MRYLLILLLAVFAASSAQAESRGSGTPGKFDYYVLALSWSPSHCASEDNADSRQCSGGRPYAFIVHGLWPQYERGWPQFCGGSGRERVKRKTISKMIDVMPSVGLIRHQWNKHGTCSGLNEDTYFNKVLEARSEILIPPAFNGIEETVLVNPNTVEKAFRAANPGLRSDAIHVTCGRRLLREVRICMTKSLEFRACKPLERNSCRLDKAVMPPVR